MVDALAHLFHGLRELWGCRDGAECLMSHCLLNRR
jgi:hypothetical protein